MASFSSHARLLFWPHCLTVLLTPSCLHVVDPRLADFRTPVVAIGFVVFVVGRWHHPACVLHCSYCFLPLLHGWLGWLKIAAGRWGLLLSGVGSTLLAFVSLVRCQVVSLCLGYSHHHSLHSFCEHTCRDTSTCHMSAESCGSSNFFSAPFQILTDHDAPTRLSVGERT